MNKKPKLAQVADRKARPPVRVKLERKNCYVARAHPPDGEKGVWWERLKDALGTASSAFVEASSFQLIAAARLPGGGISEIAVNAALAFIEGAKPRDEVESALVIQMACTHTATMAVREAWRSTWPGPKHRGESCRRIPLGANLYATSRDPPPAAKRRVAVRSS